MRPGKLPRWLFNEIPPWILRAALIASLLLIVWLLASIRLPVGKTPITAAMLVESQLLSLQMSLNQFKNDHGRFPPFKHELTPNSPSHSWRTLLLPYVVGDDARRYRFDESWNSDHNAAYFSIAPFAFLPDRFHKDPDWWTTSVVAVNRVGSSGSEANEVGFLAGKRQDARILIAILYGSGIAWNEPRDISESECLKSWEESRLGEYVLLSNGEICDTSTAMDLLIQNRQ